MTNPSHLCKHPHQNAYFTYLYTHISPLKLRANTFIILILCSTIHTHMTGARARTLRKRTRKRMDSAHHSIARARASICNRKPSRRRRRRRVYKTRGGALPHQLRCVVAHSTTQTHIPAHTQQSHARTHSGGDTMRCHFVCARSFWSVVTS